jgi:hypothetical protein
MLRKLSLVVTTINPYKNLRKLDYISKKNSVNFIIVGDKKTPSNFKTVYGEYLSLKKQKNLNFRIAKKIPYNSYSRKNIGYLKAIQLNSEFIIETDDDNEIDNNFFKNISLYHYARNVLTNGWVNIYKIFLKDINIKIWPRGLPFENIKKYFSLSKKKFKSKFYIQQGICNGDPDVDAIFRILNVKKKFTFKKNLMFCIKPKTYVPINSQNTIWHSKAFSLLYLPSFCSMRATDIWRGLISKIILSNDKKNILFKSSDVIQKRNKHNLIKDLSDEMELYENLNFALISLLKLNLLKGEVNYTKNLITIYEKLVSLKIFPKKEIILVKLWIRDFNRLAKSSKK